MKRIGSVLLVLALACLWGCSGGPAPADKASGDQASGEAAAAAGSETSGSGEAVFEDDFEAGKASGWTDGDEAAAGETEAGDEGTAPGKADTPQPSSPSAGK